MKIAGIREARKARGWTQDQLGKRAGLQTALIGSYEVGRRPLHRKDAKKIGKALDMEDLQLRISNATEAFDKAAKNGDAQGAIKAAGRLIELAEEADIDGGYTVDWDALQELMDGLSNILDEEDDEDDEPKSKKARESDDDGQKNGPFERDGFGRRINKGESDYAPASRDAFGFPDRDSDRSAVKTRDDDGPAERDLFGRRVR